MRLDTWGPPASSTAQDVVALVSRRQIRALLFLTEAAHEVKSLNVPEGAPHARADAVSTVGGYEPWDDSLVIVMGSSSYFCPYVWCERGIMKLKIH